MKTQTLRSRLNRLFENKKKLEHKKKLKACSTLQQYNEELFLPNFPTSANISNFSSVTLIEDSRGKSDENESCNNATNESSASANQANCTSQTSERNDYSSVRDVSVQTDNCVSPSMKKHVNLLQYEVNKKKKHMDMVKNLISVYTEKLNSLKSRIGHFSLRNVKKRDETARKTRHLLRQASYLQKLLLKLRKIK